MKRHRRIAGAPERNAGETWGVITSLIADTLERSEEIERADVEGALNHAAGLGRMLVSGGHLREQPLTVTAAEMELEINIASGDSAVELEENLKPVPGAAGASSWTIYLPQCGPLAQLARKVAAEHPNLSAEEPEPEAAEEKAKASSSTSPLNETALAAWAKAAT